MDWVGGALDGFVTLASDDLVAQYIVLPSQVASFTDATLVRTRGIFYAHPAIVSTVSVDYHGAAGIIPWDDINDTVPAAGERPDPFTDTNADWLWHTFFYGVGGTGTAAKRDETRVYIDSKAMRRMGANKGVLMLVRNASANAMLAAFAARCLFKE